MVTKNQKRNIAIIVLIVLGVIIILSLTGNLTRPFVTGISSQTFTPIFCNDYEFTCCNEKIDFTQQFTLSNRDALICPSTASKCEIVGALPDNVQFGIGSQNCEFSLLRGQWNCDDTRFVSFNPTLRPNEFIWVNRIVQVPIVNTVYKLRLDFCGKAGCTVGVPVLGADQCKFNPENDKIYTTIGQLIEAVSWTVPQDQCVLSFQRGNRHICGYKEESCFDNNDCGGHTFGRFECIGRTLQEFGCVDFGQTQPLEKDRLPTDAGFGTDSNERLFGKRCEVIRTQQVQCCGDADCGINQFCDRETWTCRQEVQCRQNVDCGVSIQCDSFTKKLKTPICSFGTCEFLEESVECCGDENCPSGFFCNADRECEERLVTCTTCPFECCNDECTLQGGYFDKPCPENKPFCVDNTCREEFEPKNFCKNCDDFALSKILPLERYACKPKILHTTVFCAFSFIKFFLILPVLIFATLFGFNFFQTSKQLRIKDKRIAFIVSLLIAGILALTTFFLFWTGIILALIYIIFLLLFRLFIPGSFIGG